MGNTFKTALLLTAMTLLLLVLGQAFGGQNGMFMALVFAGIMGPLGFVIGPQKMMDMFEKIWRR